ncbi:MAG: hypothetical protein HC802_05485 [Caldilineaceae bacterium]|nr:hypothetical protein [Caldilineaceae bacterium]
MQGASAQAESLSQVLCGQLGSEDCALLQRTQVSMSELTSGSSDFRFDLSLGNLPGLPLDEVEITLGGNYTFVTDPETLATLHDFQSMDPQELSQDRDALLRFVQASILGVDSVNELYVELPTDLADLISLYTGLPPVSDLEINVRIVDGILYLELDNFSQFVPELAGSNNWVGIDLLSLVDLTAVNAGEQIVQIPDLVAMQNAIRSPGLGIAGLGLSLGGESELGEAVDVRRLRDSHLNEGDVAVFAYEFDLARFIGSPVVQALASELLLSSGAMQGSGLTADDLATASFALQMFAPVLFDGLEQEITSAIGLEDEVVYDFHAT